MDAKSRERAILLASIHKDADYNDILIEMAIDDLNENENGRDN